ncbi:MAG: MipA/OmpV family protein [Granulosicoccus sp.]
MYKKSKPTQKKTPGMSALLALTLGFVLCSGAVAAANTVNDINADGSVRNANGGFFELGVNIHGGTQIRHRLDPEEPYDKLGIELDLSAGYRYGRLFVEATRSSFGGVNAGITIAQSEHWDVDFLLASIDGTVSSESDEPPPPVTERERNRALIDRDTLYIAAGARITGYFDDNIIQLSIGSDWYEGNGILGSLRVGRQWQFGNWNTQAIAGVAYHSPEFNDYRFGIDANEASERFPAYRAGNAWLPKVEFGLSVPVKENWVYTSRLRYILLPDSVADSPLINRDDSLSVSTGIYYVF